MSIDSPSVSPSRAAPQAAASRASLALPHRGRAPLGWRMGALLALVALLGILGSWTHHAIDLSLRQMRAETLSSLLDAEAQALDVWIAEKELAAKRLARDSRLRARVAALASAPHGAPCMSLEAAGLRESLDPFLQDETVAAFFALDAEARMVAAMPQSACGGALPGPLRGEALRALSGETRFVRPLRVASDLATPHAGEGDTVAVWFLTPVLDAAGRTVGALALGKYADSRFFGILAAARSVQGVQAFAFDERGTLLSPLLSAAPPASGGLVRTRLVEEALGAADANGVVLESYADMQGAQVIGAWRRLPERGMALAVEIDAERAYAPLALLNAAFGIVLGVAALATAASLLYAFWVRRRMGEAQRLGAYVLERKIGEGGMADVYLARHALLRRPTAVKILRPEHGSGPQFVERFEREVKLASQLAHPNTVEIYDYGRTADGLLYYAMEYLDGIELLELVKRGGPTPVARAVYLLRQVCAGLAEAHAKGLVHRDIKPENIMVCVHGGEHDVVKILDFGLVKNVAEPHTHDLTRTLKVLGTPPYMAPERFRSAGDVDARADIYAVGAVAFYVLTGRDVFHADDDLELAQHVLNDPAPRPSSIASQPIPIELDLLVTACLEKRREDRPQRVTDLIEALDMLAARFRWTQREAAEWWAAHRDGVAGR